MNVIFGGCLKPCSHRRISLESACADIESNRSIFALTFTIWPSSLICFAPSTSSRPRVPAPWKPTNMTVFRLSGEEMVQHTTTGRHAARGDDDGRRRRVHDGLRLIHRLDDRHALGGEHR